MIGYFLIRERYTLAKKYAQRPTVLAVERDAFVVFGHCPKQCPMLKKMPEYYG